MGAFPSEPGLAHFPQVCLLHLSWKISGMHLLWTRCPSCHQNTDVKALKKTQSTNPI